jgi:hypothetical protein
LEAELSQAGGDLIDPAPGAGGDVLDDDPPGAQLTDDPGKLKPQSRALSSKARALACARDVLAGETATDDIDGAKVVLSDCADIIEPFNVRPVTLENETAELRLLDLPNRVPEPRPFETKFEPTDAGE